MSKKFFKILSFVCFYIFTTHLISAANAMLTDKDDDKDGNGIVKRMGGAVSSLGTALHRTQISKVKYKSSGTMSHVGPKGEKMGEKTYNVEIDWEESCWKKYCPNCNLL